MKEIIKNTLLFKLFGIKIIPAFFLLAILLCAYLYSHYREEDNKENFQDIVQVGNKDNFTIAISPHHLVAKDLIAGLFSQIVDSNVEDVVIISPNHFNQGMGNIQSSLYLKSKLAVDQRWIKKMDQAHILSIEEKSFLEEHGVNNLLPYIENSFPNAKIIPIIISETANEKQVDNLANALNYFSDKKARVILSADFSHYLTNAGAQFHNIYSLKTLKNIDLANVSKVDIDCQKGLEVIMKIAKLNGFNFKSIENSNAAILGGNDFAIEPTSYITGIYSKSNSSEHINNLNITFFGNMVSNRLLLANENGSGLNFALSDMERIFLGTDFSVANLESVPSNGDIWDGFKKRGLSLVADGFAEQDGMTYGIFKFDELQKNAEEETINNILNNKNKTKINIVYANWMDDSGNVKQYESDEILLAHKFIDAGADVVFGNHPSKIEHVEKYNGKYIFYSIGSFFDGVSLSVGMNCDKLSEKVTYYLMPIGLGIDQKEEIIQGDKLKNILYDLSLKAVAPDDIKGEIARGVIFD